MGWSREDLSWVAGFIEGEGCFHAGSSRSISVAQVDREPLDKLQSLLGFGAIRGPFVHLRGNHRPYYRWDVTSFELAQATVAAIWTWLSSRRKTQATNMLEAWKLLKVKRGSPRDALTCSRGHPKIDYKIDHLGRRYCAECHNITRRLRKERAHDERS